MKIIITLCILMFLPIMVQADKTEIIEPAPIGGALYIAADYACFKYSDNVDICFAEIYYSLNRGQLAFQPDSQGYHAMLDMYVEIRSADSAVVDANSWRVANRIASLAEKEIQNYLINDIIKASLEPGDYEVTIKAIDAYSNEMGQTRLSLTVPAFSLTELNISQIELAFKIMDADGGNFDKAGKKVIPNTRAIFSHDDNIVYFYGEAYNLDRDLNTYTYQARIYDGNGNLYKELPPKTSEIVSNSEVLINGFNISSFKLGMYKLVISVYAGGHSVSSEKYFEITPGRHEWELAMEKEELSDFPEADEITTEEEAIRFRNQVLYVASRDELKQYDALPLRAKSNFAKAFWTRRDPTPQTAINEFKLEHYERFRYVNEAFSTFRAPGAEKNGWRSDRGRVHIVYGPPSDEENYPSSLEELPWIQWNYDNVEGGVIFIFVDESGYGNYRLIHSTAKSEPKDYNWQTRIRPSSADFR